MIEGAKAVVDVFSPINGTIRGVNESLTDDPYFLSLSKTSPYIHHLVVVDGTIPEGDSLLTWSEYKRLTNE